MKSVSASSPKESSVPSIYYDKKKPTRPSLLHKPKSYPVHYGLQQNPAYAGSLQSTAAFLNEDSSDDEARQKGHIETIDYAEPAWRINRNIRPRTEMVFNPKQDMARESNVGNTRPPRMEKVFSTKQDTVRDGNVGNTRQPRTERFSPILEEDVNEKSPRPEGAVASPFTVMETSSTESTKTVKLTDLPYTPGANQVSTPSYPFPQMLMDSGTPTDVIPPDLHRPFTALSPTTSPVPHQSRQNQRSRDQFTTMNSMPNSRRVFGSHAAETPDLFNTSLKFMSEPGLERWWANVSQVLRDDFLASRATLAVPSDSTDVENVPWAQMATFNTDGAQRSSSTLRDSQTSHSGIVDPNGREEVNSEANFNSKEKTAESNSISRTHTLPKTGRPKLESRHSFAGFPHRLNSMITEKSKNSVANTKRPAASRTNSSNSLHGDLSLGHEKRQGTTLSSKALHQHLVSEASKASQSGDTTDTHDWRVRARVLPNLQMLEMEFDPLLNSAGAIRVLERGDIVHLTREYYDASQLADHGISGRMFGIEQMTSWSVPEGQNLVMSPNPSEKPPSSSSFMNQKPNKRPGSQTSSSSKSTSGASVKDEVADSISHAPSYEDYEQIPVSPWSQSPAPSPAVQADPEANPFFVDAPVDEEAFSENPPAHDYTSDCQIEVIGVDRACSIVHIPLVHPLVSKSKRQPRLNDFGGKRLKWRAPSNQRSAGGRGTCPQASVSSLDEDRKTPIAILSILSSTVPYPQSLSSALKLLAPHLATSLYIARQHSNLEKQLDGISRRESNRNHSRPGDLTHSEVLSPSAESATSASEYSCTSVHSPRGSNAGTPVWDTTVLISNDEQSINSPLGETIFDAGDGKRSNPRRTQSGTVASPRNSNIPTMGASTELATESVQGSPTRNEHHKLDIRFAAGSTTSKLSRKARGLSATPKDEHTSLPQGSAESLERAKEESQRTAGTKREANQSRRYPEALDLPRRRTMLQAPSQENERSKQHHKPLHIQDVNSVPINPPFPSNATEMHPAIKDDPKTVEVEELEFRSPTSSMLKLMLDSGAVQEFIAEPHTGNIFWANSRFRSYRNETPAQIRQKPWDAIHQNDRTSFRKLWKNALHTGEQISHQVRLRRFDGHYRWFHIRIVPMEDSYSSVKYWHGQAMDIHEQHIAEVNAAREKEKAASESKYRSLANSNPHIIFAASVPDGMTFANTQWLSYSGQSFDDALGFGFLDHVHSEDITKCQFPALSGVDIHYASSSSSALHSQAHGEDPKSFADLSEVSASTDETLKGGAPESTDDETAGSARVLAPSGLLRNLANKGVIKASKDGQGRLSITTEMRLRSKSGQYRWHLVQGSLIESVNFGQGEAQWIIACADISDQKGIEEKLKEANTTLETETTRKMQFLSTMSHEIRTPLNGIIGNLQFLLNSQLDEYQAEWTYGAHAAARGMHDLINDILDVSKAEAKMLTLYYDWFHIRSIIEDVFETLASKANEKRLELCYSVEKHVPSNVKGDGGRIRQILLNLVSNAIKFTQRGEIFVNCTVKKDPIKHVHPLPDPSDIILLFNVQDTGSGFTEDDAKILFRPYSQIDNSSTRHNGGTGLGLLLCKQMVELHHGHISAFSTPGKGSTFAFSALFKLPTATDRPKIPYHNSSSSDTRDKKYIFSTDLVASPSELSVKADTAASSASSDPSLASSVRASRSSLRSSASSLDSRDNVGSLDLALPSNQASTDAGSHPEVVPPPVGVEIAHPPLYSILIVCPQENTRRTTEAHIRQILPQSIPAQVTASEDVIASHSIISGEEPINFTHVVLQLNEANHVLAFMDLILNTNAHSHTSIVLITDQAQQAVIMSELPAFNYDQLISSRRLHFVLKPARPPKFAKIFDPKQENALSKDYARANAAEAVDVTKQAFKRFENILGNRGIRVLAVEDNKLNMKMLTHFLRKMCRLDVIEAWDGEECTNLVFSHEPLYYSVIICDIQMPNKDGYETCREIRAWEKINDHPHVPIIALSANIMAEGQRDSAAAGFTQYTTKPVEWRTLGNLLIDLVNPNMPHVFLSDRLANER